MGNNNNTNNMKHIIKIIVLPLLMILQYSCISSQENKSEQVSASWTELPTTNFPLMRGEYAMAYNSRHKKIVAYGGRTGFRSDFQNVNETWAFDYKKTTWVNLEAKSSPPWRSSHAMVYDQVRDMVVLFGGNDFTKAFNDLWQYDYSSNTWTNITPDYSPEARQMHGMVYIPDREVIIVFGGRRLNGGAAFSDIWELNRRTYTWKKLNPENSPGVSDHVNITYDQLADKVLLYIAPAIWVYDFDSNNWTELEPNNKPDLDHSSFIYEPKYNKSLLFGNVDGFRRQTWVFDYSTNSWTNITPRNMFSSLNRLFNQGVRIEHDGMVYLEDEQVFVQYGGCCTDETLELK